MLLPPPTDRDLPRILSQNDRYLICDLHYDIMFIFSPALAASCRCRCHSGRRLVFRETNLSPPTTYCNRCHRDCVAPFAKCPDFGIRPGGGRF